MLTGPRPPATPARAGPRRPAGGRRRPALELVLHPCAAGRNRCALRSRTVLPGKPQARWCPSRFDSAAPVAPSAGHLLRHRPGQPPPRDRRHLECPVSATNRHQHREQALAARPRLRSAGLHRGGVAYALAHHQSRRAIERLGAKQDGVLRSHKIMPDGTLRDTVVYSILQHEWPAVRNELRRRLADQAAQNHLPLTVR